MLFNYRDEGMDTRHHERLFKLKRVVLRMKIKHSIAVKGHEEGH